MKDYKYTIIDEVSFSESNKYEVFLSRSEINKIRKIESNHNTFLSLNFISELDLPKKIKLELFYKVKSKTTSSYRYNYKYRKNVVLARSKMDNKDNLVGNGGRGGSRIRFPKKNRKGAWKKFKKLFNVFEVEGNLGGSYKIIENAPNKEFKINQ